MDAAPEFERAKVAGKRLLTWPSAVTKRLNLTVGDYLYVFVDGRRITMVLAQDLAAELKRREKDAGDGKRRSRQKKS